MSQFATGSPQPGEECCGTMSNFSRFDRDRKVHVAGCSYCDFECDDSELVDGEKPHKVVAAATDPVLSIDIGPLSIDIGPLPAIGTAEVVITAEDGRVFRQRLDGAVQQRPGESFEDFKERLRAASMEKVRAVVAAMAEAPPDERKH